MTRWLGLTSLLNGISLLVLVTGAGATGHQSVAITMDPSPYGEPVAQYDQILIGTDRLSSRTK